jgi:hypothetical protein
MTAAADDRQVSVRLRMRSARLPLSVLAAQQWAAAVASHGVGVAIRDQRHSWPPKWPARCPSGGGSTGLSAALLAVRAVFAAKAVASR